MASTDQSPASRLVQQAADSLESLSRNLADKEPGELLNAVRDFGRKNPAAFIGGAVLVGLALGRFARASETSGTTGLSGEPLTFAEADYDDLPPAAPQDAGIDSAIQENLGGLESSTATTTASPVGTVDDGTSGIGEEDATTSPHIGGR